MRASLLDDEQRGDDFNRVLVGTKPPFDPRARLPSSERAEATSVPPASRFQQPADGRLSLLVDRKRAEIPTGPPALRPPAARQEAGA